MKIYASESTTSDSDKQDSALSYSNACLVLVREKSLSESRKQKGLDLSEAASEHGLRCAGSLEASIFTQFWQLALVAGIQGPGCQTWQGVMMKQTCLCSESAERGFSRSDGEELCLLELGNSKYLSAWYTTWAPRAIPADHCVPAWHELGAVTLQNYVSQWKLVVLCRGLPH